MGAGGAPPRGCTAAQAYGAVRTLTRRWGGRPPTMALPEWAGGPRHRRTAGPSWSPHSTSAIGGPPRHLPYPRKIPPTTTGEGPCDAPLVAEEGSVFIQVWRSRGHQGPAPSRTGRPAATRLRPSAAVGTGASMVLRLWGSGAPFRPG